MELLSYNSSYGKNLYSRGWTLKLVNKYLKPDHVQMNWRYPSSPPMKLYSLNQVERVEKRVAPELKKVLDTRLAKRAKENEAYRDRSNQYEMALLSKSRTHFPEKDLNTCIVGIAPHRNVTN